MSAVSKSESLLQWLDVCALDDLIPEAGVCARLGSRHVAIFYLPDEPQRKLYALDNIDPFSDASVLARGIVGDIKGELVVASPVYKQHFALGTGQCLEDAAVAVDAFLVRHRGGRVEVALEEGMIP